MLKLKKINEIIKTGYLTNQPVMITTYKPEYIDIGLAVWIYFFNINIRYIASIGENIG